MSLKKKLSIIFSLVVTAILLLNNTLYYYSTRDLLREDQEKQTTTLAKQLSIAIEHAQYSSLFVEDLIGEKLRVAAIAAQFFLDPDIEKVTNEQLVELSEKIGISYITLLKQEKDDIKGVKSSDPKERDLSTKEWGYWYTAFQQLFEHKNVTIPEGQKLPYYWSGPIDVSSSDPNHIDKWGYYYDGTTNYIINPYVRDKQIMDLERKIGPESIVDKAMFNSNVYIEITGFNPRTFGYPPVYTEQNEQKFVEIGNKAIQFGDYSFKDERDIQSVRESVKIGKTVSYHATTNGKEVYKSFIPVTTNNPYVIGIVTDYNIIQETLNKQCILHIEISIFVLIVVYCSGYVLASYIVNPINRILKKVNEIADGNFGDRVSLNRKDELGILSERVNTMSLNLENYKKAEEMMVKSEKLAIAGQLAAGVAHEIRNPLTSLKGFVHLMKNGDGSNHKYLDVMTSELNRIEMIVSEMLVLAKPQAISFKMKELKEIMQDVITLIETQANL
ncbi:MAG: histidine kinase dimerization/phospho-acceptor domain-containing protein, partial [Bacilli bacterium]